jgi:hypothetical protein
MLLDMFRIVLRNPENNEARHIFDINHGTILVNECYIGFPLKNKNRSCLLFRHRKGNLPNNVIQAFCEESTPNFVCWDSEKCNNFRKKIERLHANMSPQEYTSQSNFEANFMSTVIL